MSRELNVCVISLKSLIYHGHVSACGIVVWESFFFNILAFSCFSSLLLSSVPRFCPSRGRNNLALLS